VPDDLPGHARRLSSFGRGSVKCRRGCVTVAVLLQAVVLGFGVLSGSQATSFAGDMDHGHVLERLPGLRLFEDLRAEV